MKKLYLFLFLFFLFYSCNYSNSNSFINEKRFELQKDDWHSKSLLSYSFDFDIVINIPPSDYSFSINVVDGSIVLKKYSVIDKEDVSGLSDLEVEAKIQQIIDNLGENYADSYDKMCIELSNLDDLFLVINSIYSQKLKKYKDCKNKSSYVFRSNIEYDNQYSFPYYFYCKSMKQMPMTGANATRINVRNFVAN